MSAKNIREIIKKPWFAAFSSGALVGILTHLFGLVNVLHNFDDIAVQPSGYGTGLKSGRWLLTILGDFVKDTFGGYNLPYVNGILFILLVAASAAFVVATLKLEKRRWAVAVGTVFAVFPCTTSTLFYRYTAVYYGIALLLSVLAVYFLDRYRFGLPLSIVCTAFSLGIYQAYVPVTVTLFVIRLIQRALKKDDRVGKLVLSGLYDCLSLVLGLGVYYVILWICLRANNMSLGTYQGVDSMGKISISALPGLIKKAYASFLKLPIKDYCALAQTKLLRLCYLLLGLFSFALTGYALATRVKKGIPCAFVVAMGLILPVAFNFIVIMCPDSRVYTLMVYSFALAPCFPIVILDCISPSASRWQQLFEKISNGTVAVVLTALIILYGYWANVNYTYLHYSNRQTENFFSSLVAQVRMTEDFTSEKTWAFVGTLSDPLLKGVWQKVPVFSGNAAPQRLITAYSRNSWLKNYVGYDVPLASDEDIAKLSEDPRFIQMPCWPDNGSIKVIDDTVVIKFSD